MKESKADPDKFKLSIKSLISSESINGKLKVRERL